MMPKFGRWSGHLLRRSRLPALALIVACGLAGAGTADARDVVVTGQTMTRFGRILLRFDEPTKVTARVTNAVLVITFAAPAKVLAEKLALELAPYVTTVRQDPDGTGLRLALSGPVRPNVLEAAERVFVDLLPMNWTGLPPGLPPEVVAELAARVQQAEAKLRAANLKPAVVPRSIRLRLGELPTLTRMVFEAPSDLAVDVKDKGEDVELAFAGPVTFDPGGAKPKLAAGIVGFDAVRDPNGGLTVKVKRAPGYVTRSFREGDELVVDIARPQAPQVLPEPLAPPAKASAGPMTKEAVSRPDKADAQGSPNAPGSPAAPPAPPAPMPTPPARSAADNALPATIMARVETGPDGTALVFPFRRPTPAAAYLRAGMLTLVFDSQDRLDTAALANAPSASMKPLETSSAGGPTILRFPEPAYGAVRFSADGTGWRLSTGNGQDLPADALKVSRGTDDHGRPLVRVGLSDASRAHWLREPDGARLAVVTASGRVQGLPLPRNFIEFALAPTLHGVVVEARADNVSVGLGQSGVAISREGGLSLSNPADGEGGGGPASRVVLARDAWITDTAPAAFDRYASLIWDSANAATAGRAAARFRLARFLVANSMDHEAMSVLALARTEDPVFARRREAIMLSGIAAARAGRSAEARALLTAETVVDDPEAILWRAVADASDRRWAPALGGFRRASEILELYPDDLAGPIRLMALTAALELGDVARAEAELGAIDLMAAGSVPRDRYDLARARVDDDAGRSEAAFKAYGMLVDEAEAPVAAEATLRWVRLGTKTKAIPMEQAIDRLEALSVTWHGGEIEAAAVTELARLYGEAKRWRDMFAMARRANRYFPQNPATRKLQAESAQLIEELLLGAENGAMSGVQALSLYFDFKELAPVGRRGDELARRLADRLVELDLLDQAADLLHYQIEKRLTGAARATVAARLAAIYLMNGKPLLALSALHSTRLSELPDEVRRFRFMLEARAQSELSRTDLALEILEGETGADFDRLRTSILWSARRWREAGEAGEALVGTRWDGPEALNERDRADVLRAAIAYALADERIALDRLKQKFGRKMMDSPDAKTFDTVVRPGGSQTREFRVAAQEATKLDSLRTLLTDWRSRPIETPAEPDGEKAPAAAPAGAATPRVEGGRAPVRG